jgi:hypothetical protein
MISTIIASTKILCNPLSFNERDILDALAMVHLAERRTSTIGGPSVSARDTDVYQSFFGEPESIAAKPQQPPVTSSVSVDVMHRKPNPGYAIRRSAASMAEQGINEHINNDWVKIGLGAFTSVLMGLSVNGTGKVIDWKEVAKIGTQDPATVRIVVSSFKRGSAYEKWAKEYMERWRQAHPEFLKPKSGWRERKSLLYTDETLK